MFTLANFKIAVGGWKWPCYMGVTPPAIVTPSREKRKGGPSTAFYWPIDFLKKVSFFGQKRATIFIFIFALSLFLARKTTALEINFTGTIMCWNLPTGAVYKKFSSDSYRVSAFTGTFPCQKLTSYGSVVYAFTSGKTISGGVVGKYTTDATYPNGSYTGYADHLFIYLQSESRWLEIVPTMYSYDLSLFDDKIDGNENRIAGLTTSNGKVTGVALQNADGTTTTYGSNGQSTSSSIPKQSSLTNSVAYDSANLAPYFNDLGASVDSVGKAVEALPHADYSAFLNDTKKTISSQLAIIAANTAAGSGGGGATDITPITAQLTTLNATASAASAKLDDSSVAPSVISMIPSESLPTGLGDSDSSSKLQSDNLVADLGTIKGILLRDWGSELLGKLGSPPVFGQNPVICSVVMEIPVGGGRTEAQTKDISLSPWSSLIAGFRLAILSLFAYLFLGKCLDQFKQALT